MACCHFRALQDMLQDLTIDSLGLVCTNRVSLLCLLDIL